jgi:DNA-directed RNA polymerase subunit RPC12/RpoP
MDSFENWKHLIGQYGQTGHILSWHDLRAWADNPEHKFICSACGAEPKRSLVSGFLHCPRCGDYKYIVPDVEGCRDGSSG